MSIACLLLYVDVCQRKMMDIVSEKTLLLPLKPNSTWAPIWFIE